MDYITKVEEMLEGYPLNRLREVANKISYNYLNESGTGNSLINDELSAKVYASMRFPATYNACLSSLKYSLEYYNKDINTLIDIGSGTGATILAIDNLINLKEITAFEINDHMMGVGKTLTEDIAEKVNWHKLDITKDEISISADIVSVSYVLNELNPNDRIKVLDKIWEASKDLILIVDTGTPTGFSVVLEARNYLINKGGNVVAPCPHNDRCKSLWCHFVTRVNRSKLHKLIKEAEAPYEDEKYSFVCISKSSNDQCYSRVTRHPIIGKGHIELELCSKDKLEKIVVSKKDGEFYKKGRKLRAGDSFDERKSI